MNSNFSMKGPDEREVQITALLLGELPPEAAAELERSIHQDLRLQELRARLEKTLGLVQAAVAQPAPASGTDSMPRRLSEARRSKLLAHLRAAGPERTPGPVANQRERSWWVPMGAAASLMVLAGVAFWRNLSDSPSVASQTAFLGRPEKWGDRSTLAEAETVPALNLPRGGGDQLAVVPLNPPAAAGIAGGRFGGSAAQTQNGPLLAGKSEGLIQQASRGEALSPVQLAYATPAESEVLRRAADAPAAGIPLADLGTHLSFGTSPDRSYRQLSEDLGRPLIRAKREADKMESWAYQNGEVERMSEAKLPTMQSTLAQSSASIDDLSGFVSHSPPPSGPIGGEKSVLERAKDGRDRYLSENRKNPDEPQQLTELAMDTKAKASITNALKDSKADGSSSSDRARAAGALAIPVPQPEVESAQNRFSTFSLNVTDVSFKLAAASLQNNKLPDPGGIRTEEFLNAFHYRDPEPAPGVAVAFHSERARSPFAHDRDLLRLAVRTSAQGREAGRPLNLVLLLDNSGSMERADRVLIVRRMLQELARQLRPQDRISVVTFARTAQLRVDGMAATSTNGWIEALGDPTPEGGTNLEEALKLGYNTCARHFLSGGGNRVVLLTDGAANLGEIRAEALTKSVDQARQRGMALDCFGVGWEGFNDEMLAELSRHGDGRYGFVNSEEEGATEFAARLAGALRVAASDVKVQVEFNPDRVKLWRQLGYAKHQLTAQQFRDNTVDAAELGMAEAGQALYAVQAAEAGSGPIGTLRVRYRLPDSNRYFEQEWEIPYERNAPALDRAPASLRLAATAAGFAEWLARSPFAESVTLDQLLSTLAGVPSHFHPDPRPQQLLDMLQQAKSLAGQSGR